MGCKIKLLLFLLFTFYSLTSAQTPPGTSYTLDGSTQFLSGTIPAGTKALREVSSRMPSARIAHGTDQVLFDWAGVGILYIRAVNAGVTNLEFVPASGTGTTTVNISNFTTGFIYRFRYDDIGPNMAYILEAWDARGDPKTVVSSIITASVSSIDPNNKALFIGAKSDGTLKLQANIDFWRWHDQWIPHYPVAGQLGGQCPYPTFAKNWQACNTINGNEDWIDFRFENNLNNSGSVSITLTATGSSNYIANSNTKPTAVGEDLTGQAKGRILLNGTRSYDYDSSGLVPTNLSNTLSSNWTCVSAPVSCGSLTIEQPTRLSTLVNGATTAGDYIFTFGVTDGSLTDTDTVTVQVVNISASVGDTSCFVDEPCLIDASASTGWKFLDINFGEVIPDSSPQLKYGTKVPKTVHRFHSAGVFTVTVTLRDAQASPTTVSDTGIVTVTARAEANGANTEDLTNSGNANFISSANCTGDPAGNKTKLQNAINIAKARNTVPQKIIVPAGCRADGSVIGFAPVGNEYITIITSGTLPTSHKRASLFDTAQLFTIRATIPNEAAFMTDLAGGSHHYKLRGIIFETAINQFSLVTLGDPSVEDSLSEISHHFIIQHCIFRSTNEFSLNIQNGIIYNANDVSIIDSYFAPISSSGIESHNALSYSSAGNHIFNNNTLGGSSINYFYGGAASSIRGLVPTNIEMIENDITRPLEWKSTHPLYDGKSRAVKNLWELKIASNMTVRGNRISNNWTDGQAGITVVIQATCDSGNWASARNIDFSYNYITNGEQGVTFRGSEYRGTLQSEKVWYTNNLLEGVTGKCHIFIQAANIYLNHNTYTSCGDSAAMDGEMRDPGIFYENSIMVNGSFGWFGSGIGQGTVGFHSYFPGFVFRDSLQIGGSSGNYASPVSGFQFPANQAAVGFTNPSGSDWSLSPSSAFKNDANDGTDPGVNWADLQSSIRYTTAGNWIATTTQCNWHTNPACN